MNEFLLVNLFTSKFNFAYVDHANMSSGLGEEPDEGAGLVGGDAAGDAEEDPTTGEGTT